MFFGECGEAFEEFLGGDIYATFALNGLDKESDRFVGDGGFGGFEVIEVGVNEAGKERAEAVVDFPLCGGGHRADGPAVKALVEGDDFVPSAFVAKSPRELDEAVVGFRA